MSLAPAKTVKASLPSLPILPKTRAASNKIRALYWGESGTGKTHYALTWPGVFYVLCDRTDETYQKLKNLPPHVHVKSWGGFQQIINAVKKRQLTEIVRQTEGYEDYKVQTVVIDSWTSLGEILELEMSQSPDQPLSQREWGAYRNRLTDVAIVLSESATINERDPEAESYHIVGIAHERVLLRDTKEGGTKIDKVTMSIPGQFAERLPGYQGVLLITDRKIVNGKAHYYCHTIQKDHHRKAFDRFGGGRFNVLPPEVDGSFQSLAKAWGMEENNV